MNIFEDYLEKIIDAIKMEFLDEFSDWNALVDPLTLSFQFNSPDVLFKKGSFSKPLQLIFQLKIGKPSSPLTPTGKNVLDILKVASEED